MNTEHTETVAPTEHGLPMIRPGERALLLSHHEYRQARSLGRGLENYDILMRLPDEQDAPDGEALGSRPESERWLPVAADKYLKHRANGWREAESADQLPDRWLEAALERDAFREEQAQPAGGE